jgi:hypothetical protein
MVAYARVRGVAFVRATQFKEAAGTGTQAPRYEAPPSVQSSRKIAKTHACTTDTCPDTFEILQTRTRIHA